MIFVDLHDVKEVSVKLHELSATGNSFAILKFRGDHGQFVNVFLATTDPATILEELKAAVEEIIDFLHADTVDSE